MRGIYRDKNSKQKIRNLYEEQLKKLNAEYKDIYINTKFGKTHLIETGNFSAKSLLVFHGGNATTAYNLLYCKFLLNEFHIYAVDTIGHPGKSAETSLSHKNQDYGIWASEVIEQLGYDKIACFGGSFGAGVLVKLMCVSPKKVERSVLLVPAAIKNALPIKSMNMAVPMIMYYLTKKESWFLKCIMPMALKKENISNEILVTSRCSIDNVRIKAGMPKDESDENLKKYKNPVLILAAEQDCLFPAKPIMKKAQRVWKQSKTYLLENRGHINELSKDEKKMITDFLKEQ